MHLRIHRNIDRIDTLMEFVDLAVSAGGSTCYELARYGVPTIVIPIAENQHPVATAMAESGAMVTLPGWHDQIQSIPSNIDSTLRRMLRRVMNNREHREQMSACGRQIVDGQGAHRIARRLSASCYTLRPATLDDAQLIWNWRNHPEVRALSFSEQRIALGSHQSWMRQKLADPNCVYWIALDKFGLPVGQIRCDVDAAGSATVNVIVEQGRRGTGIGTVLIKLAMDSMFEQGLARQMMAQIRPVNIASERAFRKVGFQPIAPTTLNGKLASQFVMKQEWLSAPHLTSRHPLKKSA
jgi:RimJ/RimL family protein N-acetyltransferase